MSSIFEYDYQSFSKLYEMILWLNNNENEVDVIGFDYHDGKWVLVYKK